MWSVYIHKAPNGKRYIGITSQAHIQRRWRKGEGYKKQKIFYEAIQEYGWDNFIHTVVAVDLSREDAIALEKRLILQFNTTNPDFGYNITRGGTGSCGLIVSAETREKLRIASTESWKRRRKTCNGR